MNKVVNVPLSGGLIGMLAVSPHGALRKVIQRENMAGWRVVQVVPASSGSILYYLLQWLVLICTLLLYTFSAGYYVILEKDGTQAHGGGASVAPTCDKCGNNVRAGDAFCEYCGNKLS